MPGVYISFPFCAQKCTFCNFASGVFPPGLERQYLEALRSEVERHAFAWRPETLYIGGGTPSRISVAELERILRPIPGRPWSESTIEAAPGSVTPEKAAAWVAAGINRVSLGVQSFVREEISRTGRKHTAELVGEEVALLRQAGIASINIDLIAGLALQTPASWRASLEWIEHLAPEHVSVYMFEIDEDSRLGKEVLHHGSRYSAPDVPSEDLAVELYEVAVEELARLGIYRYEISNFARKGMESKHNLKYWRLEPYTGFGNDAHSFDGAVRWQNVESPSDYVSRWEHGESPKLDPVAADLAEEQFFVGLRLAEGVRPGAAAWQRFQAPIDRFLREGLLTNAGGTLRLTGRGVLLSNEVLQEFIGT